MKRKLIYLLAAGLVAIPPVAWGEGEAVTLGGATVSGELSIGFRGLKSGAADPSKLKEYRDLGSGAIGAFDIRGRGEEGYLNFFGENLGRDDQYIDLRGGKYGIYKFNVYDNEMRHSFGSGVGALTPYVGAGTNSLTATFPSLNSAGWRSFDDSYTRKDMGGMFEFSNNSPWYLRTEANQVKRQGIKVISAAQGTSPGNGFVQLPSPVDFTTQNASVEAGYQGKQGNIAANLLYSKFDNGNDSLRFSNGFLGTAGVQDTVVLPPDNNLWKLGVNGTLRQLPLGSTLSGRVTYSKLTNDVGVLQNMLNTGSTNPSTGANTSGYSGNVINQSASLSLASHPLEKIDTRLYWNWNEKANKSTAISFFGAPAGLAAGSGDCGTVRCAADLFGYKRNNAGAEGSFRLNSSNKVSAGADLTASDRNRSDMSHTIDRKYFAEWKNSTFDILDTRVKYQYLERRSNFLETTYIDAYVRRFDLANDNQHLAKVTFDLSPMSFLDIGGEAIYKHNNFKDTIIGRKSDERQEYYASISYGDAQKFRVMLFGDIELTQYDSLHRVCTSGSPVLGDCDPFAPASGGTPSTAYNWSAKNRDRAYQVGLGTDWLPTERWKINSSLVYAKTNGTTDFAAQSDTRATATANLLRPIQNFDNTTRTTLSLKGTYKVSKAWDLTSGYAFERYRLSDIGYDGATYLIPPATTSASYFTGGGGTLQNYTSQMLYMVGTFKF